MFIQCLVVDTTEEKKIRERKIVDFMFCCCVGSVWLLEKGRKDIKPKFELRLFSSFLSSRTMGLSLQ